MKPKSVSLNFMSVILALLYLLHALKHSFAHAYQVDGHEALHMQESHVAALKEVAETYNYVMKAKKAIGGRKMSIDHKVQGGDHESVMKSLSRAMLSVTEDRNAVKNPHYRTPEPDSTHHQVDKSVFQSHESLKQIRPIKSEKLIDQDHEAKSRKGESNRPFEGTKEMMKLISNDYDGKSKPKRRRPIHNTGSKD